MATCNALYTPRDVQNMRVFNYWFLSAMVFFLVATFAIKRELVVPALGWTLTALSVGLLVMGVRAYIVFIRNADELLRKVQLEALALGFGAGMVFMLGWRLCERLGALKLDVSDPIIVMMLVFAVGQYIGIRRYCVKDDEQ